LRRVSSWDDRGALIWIKLAGAISNSAGSCGAARAHGDQDGVAISVDLGGCARRLTDVNAALKVMANAGVLPFRNFS
jgi:hypothetical protein